ncbi:T-brain [Aphelenchoides avenae]|nr:T-brain [Aphelenchus avenae]
MHLRVCFDINWQLCHAHAEGQPVEMDLVDDYGGTIMHPNDLASAVDSRCSLEINKGRALSMQDFLAADGGLYSSSHRSVKTEPLLEGYSAASMEAESSNDSIPSSSGSQKDNTSEEGAGLASLLIGSKKVDPNGLSEALAGMSATMDRIVKQAEENERRKIAEKVRKHLCSDFCAVPQAVELRILEEGKSDEPAYFKAGSIEYAAGGNSERNSDDSTTFEARGDEFGVGNIDIAGERRTLARILRRRNGNVCARIKQVHLHVLRFTRHRGFRKMFPRFELSVRGLNPKGVYAIVVSMRLIGPFRYISTEKRWVSSPYRSDNVAEWSNAVLHHDQCANGEHWMKQTVSFDRIKLMNRTPTGISDQEISIASLHKYQPVFQVLRLDAGKPSIVFTYEPQVTQFIGVTQYHNRAISALKIKHNPIAKKMHEGAARKRSLASMVVYQSPSFTQVTSPSPASAEDASSQDAAQPVVTEQDYTAVLQLLGSILAEKTAPTLLPLDDSPTAFV